MEQCKKYFEKQSDNYYFSDLLGAVNISPILEGCRNSLYFVARYIKMF